MARPEKCLKVQSQFHPATGATTGALINHSSFLYDCFVWPYSKRSCAARQVASFERHHSMPTGLITFRNDELTADIRGVQPTSAHPYGNTTQQQTCQRQFQIISADNRSMSHIRSSVWSPHKFTTIAVDHINRYMAT